MNNLKQVNMIKIAKLTFAIFILFSSSTVLANSLDKQINNLLFQQINHKTDEIVITYLSSKPKLDCDTPILSLLDKKKLWGNITISAQCDNKKTFIQMHVAVVGNYIVAKQSINAGAVISKDHIRIQSGRLDKLPSSVILNEVDVLNRIALRHINQDEPIKTTMLQNSWLVKAGQIIKVIIYGEGYEVSTSGKTLSNAVLNEKIRVKLNSNKIVEGTLTQQGVIIFNK
ncbi:flagellar basal body P-ring formation protein FlgA [Gilliamella sp. Pra-s65]|uniref:flagellar basal body P-ring formation chaperone FlgA n=1 Tax=unclassified Gilliamella TaxID=2685620 RepID=UPI00132B009B|nr:MULTISPECIES: flagellar basal body P-ring formation chaperone FlgA [unclassified Gilliamella]MWN31928.1 flagellar basal body P-ring formation protein FlgA [Gilliamella sp. Pra-s60]MWN90097.1 flagellar basal body P-ring formation protein FlgA [Gilliamella sp. Pra-s65]MWP29150.1 flagellar basal body P-ring formation protein FlgA [Gilliamella sp. Pra-s54]MWP47569.1 flagellar basal body P-ring formation protein FlgA [Gilliamella sp. Pas-s27]MWP73220.1 flagellar basal body P-ring formation prote